MELRNKKLTHNEFMTERQQVLKTWETGKDVENFEMALNTNKPFLSINASLLPC